MQKLFVALQEVVEPGDVLLTAMRSPVSAGIRLATGSEYCHVLVAVDRASVLESNSHAMLPVEEAEGLAVIGLQELMDRPLSAVAVLRPVGLDRARFVEVVEALAVRAPGFPTVGLGLLGTVWMLRGVLRRLPTQVARPVLRHQLRLVVDGQDYLHCAEAAARLLVAVGLPLRFRSLVFDLHARALSPGLHVEPIDPDTLPAAIDRGPVRWPGSGRGAARLAVNARFLLVALAEALRRRAATAPSDDPDGDRAGDIADVLTPADFLDAHPFEPVAHYRHHDTGWMVAL